MLKANCYFYVSTIYLFLLQHNNLYKILCLFIYLYCENYLLLTVEIFTRKKIRNLTDISKDLFTADK